MCMVWNHFSMVYVFVWCVVLVRICTFMYSVNVCPCAYVLGASVREVKPLESAEQS